MSNLPPQAQIVPAKRAVAITASTNFFDESRGIHIDTAGSFTVQFSESSTPVTMNFPAGCLPYAIVKCTAGTGLWALY